MREKDPAKQLLFDPEIKRTKRKIIEEKLKARLLDLEESFILRQENIVDADQNNQNNNNNNGNIIGGVSCYNNPRCLAHIDIPQRNICQTEMKKGIFKIRYANPFAGLDNEDLYTHFMKFYEITRMLTASKIEKEAIFLRLFPHSLFEKVEE